MNRYYVLICFLLLIGVQLFGQDQDVQNQAVSSDTIKTQNINTLLVPIVFYSPETNFAFGGGGQMFFKTKKSSSTYLNSSILASAIYTLNKQLILEFQPQIYFNNENYFLDSKFRYKVFPNLFYGIGPNTKESNMEEYNQTEISVSASFLKSLDNNVNFGFVFSFADYNVTDIQDSGILASGTVKGYDGARLVGLGFVFNFDLRDNKFSPLDGGFYQFETNFTSRVLGSTHSFNTYHLDLRRYFKLFPKHILAAQVYSRFTFGDIPFQALSYYGGSDVARGFFKGRYMDEHMYVVQLEYRMPVFKRWELAVFGLTGNVGNDMPNEKLFDSFKSSFGFGPRYFIYKNKRTCLRLDIGINNEGGTGIYFGVNEAF